jgi:hypothetical protein
VNPGASRLLIVAALVVAGVAVLANGFDERASTAAPPTSTPSPTPTESPTETEAPREVTPQDTGVLVQVFNGTNEAGFAGDFQLNLENDGYLGAGDPADAPDKPVIDTIVYFRADGSAEQNRVDARFLANEYLGGATVERLSPEYREVAAPEANVVVVLGEDQL